MLLAVAALAIGVLAYLIDRSPGSLYILPAEFSLANGRSLWFGGLGGYLPEFLHVYAVSPLTAAVLAARGSLVLIGREDRRHVALE